MRDRKRWMALTVMVVVVALGGWTANNWRSLRPYKWQQVESPDAQFRISFPGNPVASQETMTATEDGSEFVSNRLTSAPAPGVIYALNWWENPAQNDKSTDKLFADFRDCNIKVFQGKILREKEIDVQGHPAIDTVVLAANGLVVENRVIRAGPRFYSLRVLDSSGRLDHRKDVQTFFSSLSLR